MLRLDNGEEYTSKEFQSYLAAYRKSLKRHAYLHLNKMGLENDKTCIFLKLQGDLLQMNAPKGMFG